MTPDHDSVETVPQSGLWREEQAVLADLAGAVPEGGTIVELGTASGGTTLLLSRLAAERGIAVHSVDITTTEEARSLLAGTAVTLHQCTSVEAAQRWRDEDMGPIDLLFIDAGHRLDQVTGDVNGWAGLLRPGGQLAFHDYDTPAVGGAKHLAVKICVDALSAQGVFEDPAHAFKIFHGRVPSPEGVGVDAASCGEALARIAARVADVLSASARGDVDFPDSAFGRMLETCVGAIDPGQGEAGAEAVPGIDKLSACYLLAGGLAHAFFPLKAQSSAPSVFWAFAEALDMLDHAQGAPGRPLCPPASANGDLMEMSKWVAAEQVRLALLLAMLETFEE